MANPPVPSPRTFTVSETETGGYLNTVRDALNFLLNRPVAVITQTTAQSNSTASAITFNATTVDTYGGHSNSTNNSRYTAQVAGWYWVRGNVLFVSNVTGNRSCQLYKNGTALTTSFVVYPAASTNYAAMGFETSTLVFLNAGDYVELFASQDSGGALNTYVATGSSNLQLWFMHA